MLEYSDEIQAYIDEVSDPYTIDFSESSFPNRPLDAARNSQEYELALKDLNKEHNRKAAEEATDFIMSLNLKELSLESLEETCIEELQNYAEMEDAQLVSYTVNIPKSNLQSAVAASVPEGYNFFGTFGGRDFYYYYPSTASVKTTNFKQTTTSTLQNWVNLSVNLVMAFADITVTTPFTAFQIMMGAPSNYTVKTGAYTENYFNVNVHTRGIYTLYGNGSYQMLTSQQIGLVYPYVIWHPVDSPTYLGAYVTDYGLKGAVYSSKYNNSSASLCQEAWQAYNGAFVTDRFNTINMNSYNYWQ